MALTTNSRLVSYVVHLECKQKNISGPKFSFDHALANFTDRHIERVECQMCGELLDIEVVPGSKLSFKDILCFGSIAVVSVLLFFGSMYLMYYLFVIKYPILFLYSVVLFLCLLLICPYLLIFSVPLLSSQRLRTRCISKWQDDNDCSHRLHSYGYVSEVDNVPQYMVKLKLGCQRSSNHSEQKDVFSGRTISKSYAVTTQYSLVNFVMGGALTKRIVRVKCPMCNNTIYFNVQKDIKFTESSSLQNTALNGHILKPLEALD